MGQLSGLFQSTPPARGATLLLEIKTRQRNDFNPRPPHGERLKFNRSNGFCYFISIHAPRTGSDDWTITSKTACARFQSTPPARGATTAGHKPCGTLKDFNPRPPHGERLIARLIITRRHIISIHAPRTGSDRTSPKILLSQQRFQSTPPARGATDIDIHIRAAIDDFNPRPPHGERPINPRRVTNADIFQSTPPARGATSG